MPENVIKWLESDGLRVAAMADVVVTGEYDVYAPFTSLGFVQQGRMSVLRGSRMDHFGPGDFVLVRKFTSGKYFKTWSEIEGSYRMLGFLFQDEFIKGLVDQLPASTNALSEVPQVVHLPSTTALTALIASMEVFFAAGKPVDRALLRLKTHEAILSVVQADPRTAAIFKAYAQPLRADLSQFMERFIVEKMKLDDLARLSGRSLSAFNREFRQLFRTSPHQWIKKRRLDKARDLMEREGRSPSDVYLAVGFEDLAHFSRSFKQQFGRNPSELKAVPA